MVPRGVSQIFRYRSRIASQTIWIILYRLVAVYFRQEFLLKVKLLLLAKSIALQDFTWSIHQHPFGMAFRKH